MQVREVVINYNSTTELPKHLYLVGDMHLGTVHCDEDGLERKFAEIRVDPNALWLGMGDYGEFITPSDPRWEAGVIADWVDADDIGHSQESRIIELMSPVREKCIGLLWGNHEGKIHKHNHQDVQKHICTALGVPNLGYSAFVRFCFRRGTERHVIRGAFTHGAGGSITEGAKLLHLIRFMKAFDADIYGYGHVHDYIPKSYTRLAVNDKNRIVNRVSLGVTTGCWFRTYTQDAAASYGEQECYAPNELCAAVFTLNPLTGVVDVSRSI